MRFVNAMRLSTHTDIISTLLSQTFMYDNAWRAKAWRYHDYFLHARMFSESAKNP